MLSALGRQYADCFRFCYSFDEGARFVGATPERLVARFGEHVFTEALAGSVARTGDDTGSGARELMTTDKLRHEHELVARAIESVLRPLCTEPIAPCDPEVRSLHHVLHLRTPIRGRLRRPMHVLELVDALHPTPAVGGVPTRKALEWIAQHEPVARGWYAAPVGWFDAQGEGEFAVAIRSGLLADTRAYVYAGAGIVRDSDADAELAETHLKQRALLDALGVRVEMS